jgi:Zn-dependent protease with chaperone function
MRFRHHQAAAEAATRRLVGLFVLVVLGLLVAVNLALAGAYFLTVPFARGLPTLFIETNSALVLLFVLGGCWVESMRLHKGGPHVAELAGARPAQPGGHNEDGRREQRFVNIVQEMAIASGQRPPPQAWVLPRDDAINALAAGWSADDSVVVVTRGALERLTRAELQGVVAHEFSHIVNGDTRLNMRLVGLVWGLQMIWGLGISLAGKDELGRRGAGALAGVALMAVGSLGWLAGRLLQAAVSRQREFLADASAVKFARHVDGLGGALRKIADQQARHVRGLSTAHAASLSHLLLSDQVLSGGGWRQWLATHPPLVERLSRLYGRALDGDEVLLAADRVALEAVELVAPAEGNVVRMAPALGASGAAPYRGGSSEPDAARHDALQRPDHFDTNEREREALARIALWHGAGEWQCAMLALAIDGRASDAPARWRAYQQATSDLHVATTVRGEVQALGAGARRAVFTQLLDQARQAPPAQRRHLLREWSKRRRDPAWHGLTHDADRWRALVIRHAFAPAASAAPRATLSSQGEAIRAATRALSKVLARSGMRTDWHDAAIARLEAMGLPPRRGPGVGLAPPTVPSQQRELHLALRVRRLSPMQRPLLLRAWIEAAQAPSLIDDGAAGDALHAVCVALDMPVPDALRGEAPRPPDVTPARSAAR